MRSTRLLTSLTTVVLLAGLSAGCTQGPSADPPAAGSPTASPPPAPAIGASRTPVSPPGKPMSAMEKPIARELAAQVRGSRLTLDYLDCPHWDHRLPGRIMCHAYIDGVKARVRVQLHRVAGTSISYDARLLDGVVSTANLERILRDHGYGTPDCGAARAYPTTIGARIVCQVKRTGQTSYVVATVANRSGAVRISDYRR